MKLSGYLVLASLLFSAQAFGAADKIRLVWNDDPATTMVIAWDQLSGEAPVVRFDTADWGRDGAAYRFEKPPTRVSSYRGMRNHFVKLEDLRSDTVYHFVIADSDGVSEPLWFRTAPSVNRPFTFVAGGDTKTTGDLMERARWSHRMVAKLRPLFAVFDGDFCSDLGTSDAYWQLWLTDWSTETRTADGRMTPLVPVVGNHEAGDLQVVHELFDAPIQNDDPTATYYGLSFGQNLFHLALLNSEIDVDGAQSAWLAADLGAHRGYQFLAAAYHKAMRPHTTSKPDQDGQYDAWAGLFYNFGVDLVFEGDSHLHKITYPIRPTWEESGQTDGFIRDDLFGTMYVGEGSWGAQTRADDDIKPWTMTSGTFNQIKWVHVYPNDGDVLGQLLIHTVITGQMVDGEYVEQVSDVGENGEADRFALPENIRLAETPTGDPAVAYPVRRQLQGYAFQPGVGGYNGLTDIELSEVDGGEPIDAEPLATVVVSEAGASRQALLRFVNIFGDANWQVPDACEIEQASVRLWVADGTADGVEVLQMLREWNRQSTWDALDGGVSANGVEAAVAPVTPVEPIEGAAYHWFDVTDMLQSWHGTPGTNYGFALLGSGPDDLVFYTSEWDSARHRPRLVVQCKAPAVPEPDTDGQADTETPTDDPRDIAVNRGPAPSSPRTDIPPGVELAPAPEPRYTALSGCGCTAVSHDAVRLRPTAALRLLFR